MSKTKVLLIGPYPPPYGGLATQVCEWYRHLAKLETYECAILNIGESRKDNLEGCIPVRGYWDFLRKLYGFTARGYLIHLITNGHNFKSWLCALVCTIAGYLNGRKTVIVFGSGNLPGYLRQVSGWKRLVVRTVVREAGVVVCRNQSMVHALERFGDKPRIEVVSGFIGLSDRQFGPIPQAVDDFCNTHEPILGATVNLAPEYGVPLTLQAVQQMLKHYPKLGVILIGIGPEEEQYLSELTLVREHVLLAGPLSLDVTLSVMKRLSVFLRPTYFDGDSNSVREALALGIPVVASETGFRPDGTRLFKVGDCGDLCRQIHMALEQGVPAVGSSEPRQEASAHRMLELYRRLECSPP